MIWYNFLMSFKGLIIIGLGGFVVGFLAGGISLGGENLKAEVKSIFGGEELLAEVEVGGENEKVLEEKKIYFNLNENSEDKKKEDIKIGEELNSDKVVLNIDLRGVNINLITEGGLNLQSSGSEEKVNSGNVFIKNERNYCLANEFDVSNHGGIFISEVAWMGTEDGVADEWIELKNSSGSATDISGWQLLNKDRSLAVIFPEGSKISGRGFYLMERTDDQSVLGVGADLIYKGALQNEDEILELFDDDCRLIDEVKARKEWPAGSLAEKKTMERDWITLEWKDSLAVGGTPGGDNNLISDNLASSVSNEPVSGELDDAENEEEKTMGGAEGKIIITEIQAGSTESGNDEFIELYNSGSGVMDLTGWSVKKKAGSGNESSLVAMSRLEGKSIGAGKKFLIVNEGGYDGAVVADANWATSNTIAYVNNSVVVYNAEGQNVFEVSWTEIPKDKSYEKAGESWQIQETPSPENSGSFSTSLE